MLHRRGALGCKAGPSDRQELRRASWTRRKTRPFALHPRQERRGGIGLERRGPRNRDQQQMGLVRREELTPVGLHARRPAQAGEQVVIQTQWISKHVPLGDDCLRRRELGLQTRQRGLQPRRRQPFFDGGGGIVEKKETTGEQDATDCEDLLGGRTGDDLGERSGGSKTGCQLVARPGELRRARPWNFQIEEQHVQDPELLQESCRFARGTGAVREHGPDVLLDAHSADEREAPGQDGPGKDQGCQSPPCTHLSVRPSR